MSQEESMKGYSSTQLLLNERSSAGRADSRYKHAYFQMKARQTL